MSKSPDWKTYYTQTKASPPSPLLVKALEYVQSKGRALDVGGGALKDTRLLLKEGFEVTDIDSAELPAEIIVELDPKNFHFVHSAYADFKFSEGEYDLVNAMFSLPFNPPDTFDRVFQDLKCSLKVGGIFCGNLFGDRDNWSGKSDMTFHTKERAIFLMADLDVIWFEEREYDGKLASGMPKHWHVFNVIARKI